MVLSDGTYLPKCMDSIKRRQETCWSSFTPCIGKLLLVIVVALSLVAPYYRVLIDNCSLCIIARSGWWNYRTINTSHSGRDE